MKRDNFYRRDPSRALAGMAGMTLEERGVYNTVIDLLYLTWRPVEDNRAYIAGHCGCAVQKLNPILRRLIERGKLLQFSEDGQLFISNDAFERERLAVKGIPKTQSGRACVEEKSGEVGEKSAGVEKTTPTCPEKVVQFEAVAPLEKTREDQTREERISTSNAREPVDWRTRIAEAAAAGGDMANMTIPTMQSARDLKPLVEPSSGEPCTWAEVLEAIAITAARQRRKGKPINSWSWVHDDAWRLRDARLNAAAPEVGTVIPLRSGQGPPSIVDRIGEDQAEAKRRAFALMDAEEARRGGQN